MTSPTTRPLRIAAVHHRPVRFDFRVPVAHSLARRRHTVNVCVSAHSSGGCVGHGECVPREYVTGETAATVAEALGSMIHPAVDAVFEGHDELAAFLDDHGRSDDGARNPAAWCALELALLDLAGRHWGMTAGSVLGLGREREFLDYSLAIPLLPPDGLARLLERAAAFGFSQAKIKVDGSDPADFIRPVRRVLGPDVELRLDANCSWKRENAEAFIRTAADLGVVSVEQPLDPADLGGMARLRGLTPVSIMADESVCSPGDVEQAVRAGAFDSVNVRLSKCGGMTGALRVAGAARKHGMDIQLGAHVGESCVLSAAGAQLASSAGPFRWIEGFYGTHLLEHDLCSADLRWGHGGRMPVPTGPGLGVEVDGSLLERAADRCRSAGNT